MRFSTSSPEKRKEPSTPRTQLWACVGTNPWTSSRMVRAGSRRSVWCCAKYPVTTLCPSATTPASGSISRASSLSSVVLPAPFSPITAIRSPRNTCADKSR